MIVNGHNLHVEQAGPENGPVVVLLHQGLGSVRSWQEQIPVLAQAGFHVVAYDRWGYGGSDPRPALDLPNFTTDISDLSNLLQMLRISRATLVGHSDGGTIALYCAAQHPEQVSCLVIIAAHIYIEPKMEPGILQVKQAFESDDHFRKGMQLVHGEKYEAVFYNWFNGWHGVESLGWDMRPILSQISCPILVVQGDEDEHATPQHARDIADKIPGAELWLIQGAHHMLPDEKASLFNTRMIRFLKQCELNIS
jgi:pimeloyl-ACP methyl ester carboxylesterase